MRNFFAAVALLLFAVANAAAAQEPPNLYGRWALRASGDTLMLLELRRDQRGQVEGSLTGPSHFELAAGDPVFSNVLGPLKTRDLVRTTSKGDGLELTFGKNGDAITFLWRVTDSNAAELSFPDFAGVTLPFAPARPNETVSPDLDPQKAYVARYEWPSNAEMKTIFDADQAARSFSRTKVDWSAVAKDDHTRRVRTKALLDGGELHSGLDFLHAAFVFQHGSTSNDYLLAHTLALAAMARGRPDAAWISAATLDRYLQSVGEKQIFGTQLISRPNTAASKEPYDRELVPVELRRALGVP